MAMPVTLLLVNAADSMNGAAAVILSDFECAYRAFAHDMASSMGVDEDGIIPDFIYLEDVESVCACVRECGRGDRGESIAIVACDESSFGRDVEGVAQHVGAFDMCDGVYAIGISPSREFDEAAALCDGACEECGKRNAAFLGGILLGGGLLFRRYADAPRMGTIRHKVSEAVDRLVHAVMAGERMAFQAGRLTMPSFVYDRLAMRD